MPITKKKVAPPAHRKCTKCNRKKPIKEFRTNVRAHDGYTKTCTKCIVEAIQAARKRKSSVKKKAPAGKGRTCPRCHETKKRSEFANSKRSKDGKMRVCRECRKNGAAKRQPVTKARMQEIAQKAMVLANGDGSKRPMTIQKFIKQFLRGFAIEGKEIVDISVQNKKCTVRYVTTETFDI